MFLQLLGTLPPPDPHQGLCPSTPLGDSRPSDPLRVCTPPQSGRRIDASLTYLRQKLYAYCYYVRIHLLRTTACAVRMRCDMTSLWAHSIGRFSCLWIGGSWYFAGHRYALLILATAKFIVRLSVCLSHVARVSRAQTADFFPKSIHVPCTPGRDLGLLWKRSRTYLQWNFVKVNCVRLSINWSN